MSNTAKFSPNAIEHMTVRHGNMISGPNNMTLAPYYNWRCNIYPAITAAPDKSKRAPFYHIPGREWDENKTFYSHMMLVLFSPHSRPILVTFSSHSRPILVPC